MHMIPLNKAIGCEIAIVPVDLGALSRCWKSRAGRMRQIRVFHTHWKVVRKGWEKKVEKRLKRLGGYKKNSSQCVPSFWWLGLLSSLKNILLDLLIKVWTAKNMCLLWLYFSGRCGFSPHSRIGQKVFFGVRVGFIFKQTFQFVYKLCSGMVI